MAYNPKQALPMKGFPLVFREVSWKSSDLVSPSRFNKLTGELKSKCSYYLYLDNGEFIDKLLDIGYSIIDLQAVDLPLWINAQFDKKELPPTSKILYIYNVGMEVGKTGFSDTVLNSLIVTNSNKGNITIVVSKDLNYTTFKRNYPNSAKHIELGQQILK